MDYRRLPPGASLIVLGFTVLVACGGSGGQASPTATGTPSSPVATSAPATQAPVSPSPAVAAAKDACALVSTSDMAAAFGALKPGTTSTGQVVPPAGGPPGMLDASICSYRFPNGDVSIALGHFKDNASASSGLAGLVSAIAPPSSGAPSPSPVAGLGDEASAFSGTLPAPVSGRYAGVVVRKGSVDIALSGAFAQGDGPADLVQAFEAVARKVLTTI